MNLFEVIRYAKQKCIGIFLYANQRVLAKQLDTLLPLYESWGVAAIKFGFVHVGSHRWTQWLHAAVKKCAAHHLMVDIYDEYRPAGFTRNYPNLMTQEGVRGNEEMPDATNSTILSFTRFLAGAADHTICFYQRPELKPRLTQTSNARIMKTASEHQLALSVVFFSPSQFCTATINLKIHTDARDVKVNCSLSSVRTKVSMKQILIDASTVLNVHLFPSSGQSIWIRLN